MAPPPPPRRSTPPRSMVGSQTDGRSMNKTMGGVSTLGGGGTVRGGGGIGRGMPSGGGRGTPGGGGRGMPGGAGGRGGGRSETMLGRLRPPPGFNDAPYRCCAFLPQHKLIFIGIISLLLGLVMVVGAIVGAALGLFIFIWFLGGFMKLIGAGMAMYLLIRPDRTRVLLYLTETVMELMLALLGIIAIALLMGVQIGNVNFKVKNTSDRWFSSENMKKEVKTVAGVLGMDAELIVGLSFLPLFALIALLIMQIAVTYRFIKYVEDRNEYLVRKGGASANKSVQTVVQTPTMMQSALSVTKGPDDRTMKRGGKDDQTWKSARGPPTTRGGPGSSPSAVGAATSKANSYNSVHPPSPSEVQARQGGGGDRRGGGGRGRSPPRGGRR